MLEEDAACRFTGLKFCRFAPWWNQAMRHLYVQGRRRVHFQMKLLPGYWKFCLGLAFASLIVGSVSAKAGDFVPDEVRFGTSQHFENQSHYEPGLFFTGTIFFDPLDQKTASGWVDFLLRPRIYAGGTGSFIGSTSQAFLGLDWKIYPVERVFIDIGFGPTIHNGRLTDDGSGSTLPKLGSRILLHHYYSVGFDIDDHWSLMGTYDHSSHANLCNNCDNQGVTHLGVSLGYRF
jgi:lipid A 3-O-deacylase